MRETNAREISPLCLVLNANANVTSSEERKLFERLNTVLRANSPGCDTHLNVLGEIRAPLALPARIVF